MAKNKDKKKKDEPEIKPVVFQGATLRDGFCDYTMNIKQGAGVGNHTVKGEGLYKPDLQNAFHSLNVHLALIDDIFKHAGLPIESVADADNTEFSGLYDVTGIKLKGSEENLSVILVGDKYVTSTGGERISLTSPKILLTPGSIYKWYNELKEAVDVVLAEVEAYHGGKWDPIEEEVKDSNQTSILDHVEEENSIVMQFTPRPYQTEAIDAAVTFFKSDEQYNALEILPTGSGKSVVIANIAKELRGKTIVFQPSKEILEQNYKKFISYGFRAGIYSASAGSKYIDTITFATIGSVAKKRHLFKDVKNIIIDECHLVNAGDGMYRDFIKGIPGAKVLGLTATPYRLSADFEGAQLKFLNRTNPRIFSKVLYYIQNRTLFDAGHLAKLEYFTHDVVDRSKLQMNAAGTDFTDSSLRDYYKQIKMTSITIQHANELLLKRKNLLVFCSLISEANEVAAGVPGSVVLTGDTLPAAREKILAQFKSGIIRCVINVGVLTTGFDYPELDTVLIARSTMSLALYYQIVGRAMRPHINKLSAWIVDLGGNIKLFGEIETMDIRVSDRGLFSIWNNGRQLTNVAFTRN